MTEKRQLGDGAEPNEDLQSRLRSAQAEIAEEWLESLRKEGESFNVNLLLVQILGKSSDVEEGLESSERMMALAQKYEEQRVANFLKVAEVIIHVKNLDPDEQEKRRNNRLRRWLKGTVAVSAMGSLIGGVTCIATGASIVVTSILLASCAMALAMTAVLAGGESVSSNDIVKIFKAMSDVLPWKNQGEQASPPTPKGAKK